MNRSIFIIFCLFITSHTVYTQVSSAVKITPSIRNQWDDFGHSVGIDDQFAVVGSPRNDEAGTDAGIAHIFQRNITGSWEEIQTLIPSDLQPGDLFGAFSAISGNYIVVSAPSADSIEQTNTITNAGAVYVFERNLQGIWQQVSKITASDAYSNDRFGNVALSGKYLVVGSYNGYDANGANYKSNAGAVYVFERTDGGQWLPVQKLTASDRTSGDLFYQVSVDANTKTILVGAISAGTDALGANLVPYAGAAYIFQRDGAGNWNQTQKLTASVRHAGALFGSSVSGSGSWIVVGSSNENFDENEINYVNVAGAAYLFENDGAGSWQQVRKLVASDRLSNDKFGRSVSIDGNYVLIGSEGKTDENGSNFMVHSGSAYLFERVESTWALKKKLVAPDRSNNDQFGWSVSISGAQIIIGALQEDQHPNDQLRYGAVYIFTLFNPLGIMEENDLSSVNVYPNPTNGNLTIFSDDVFTELTLMDMTGKVLNKTSLFQSGIISYSIDQPKGVYLLKIAAGKSSVIKKILVQ